jgi:hypothetical protein
MIPKTILKALFIFSENKKSRNKLVPGRVEGLRS